MAFSCDLTKLTSDEKQIFKSFIEKFKKERNFRKDASCRILCDREDIVALQYECDNEIKIVVYTLKLKQKSITIYPDVERRDYCVDGEMRSFEDIRTNGIVIESPKNCFSYTITIK